MSPEIDLVRDLIRGLRNPQVAAAVVILADRAGNVETFGIGDDGQSTEPDRVIVETIKTALRRLAPLGGRIAFNGATQPYADAARYLATGLAMAWPQQPNVEFRRIVAVPGFHVAIAIDVDGVEVARASIGEPIGEDLARQVQR